MVWTMRTVQMKLPSPDRDAEFYAGARPFDAFSLGALKLACPFSIVRSPIRPFPPRRGQARGA